MEKLLNISIENGTSNILADVYFNKHQQGKLLLFCHGFKGFKDWGAWYLVAEKFVEAGFIFVKFNFSHNGIGLDDVQNFTRLDLFEQNNYSKEISDVHEMIAWIYSVNFTNTTKLKCKELNIIGHSRGGGIALLAALENDKVYKIASWASIANFDRFGNEEILEDWKREGTKNFYNSRTKQDMKISYQFYEDFDRNKERFDLENVVKNLTKPLLVIHGKEDDAVGFSHAQRLKNWKSDVELILVENANHVFGAKHPYLKKRLPDHLQQVVLETIEFFKK
jgi:pimeloyl-ACP methyl ester carboxylesterase